ncbi:hypothetical protein BaRGS_00002376 [Batillaria attramentaria]|uniref:Uncharacterized protein n=1 Tax=Batillaria attramentaria TaxID=370345 RepID=A0ABD0M376_9CAEN
MCREVNHFSVFERRNLPPTPKYISDRCEGNTSALAISVSTITYQQSRKLKFPANTQQPGQKQVTIINAAYALTTIARVGRGPAGRHVTSPVALA